MDKTQTRIALVGPSGRMGMAIQSLVKVSACIGRENAADFASTIGSTNVYLDVSIPTATEKFIAELSKSNAAIPYVIGCTGWDESQLKTVHNYAKRAAVVLAPNFSPGVNLFLNLIEQAAPLLKKWGYNVSIHETHHTKKLDAPSGTAKAIVERLGNMKHEVHSTRAGNVVGTHEVQFEGTGDIFTLKHEALDRAIFARGAIMAAEWAAHQVSPGLYSMKDVIFGDRA